MQQCGLKSKIIARRIGECEKRTVLGCEADSQLIPPFLIDPVKIAAAGAKQTVLFCQRADLQTVRRAVG